MSAQMRADALPTVNGPLLLKLSIASRKQFPHACMNHRCSTFLTCLCHIYVLALRVTGSTMMVMMMLVSILRRKGQEYSRPNTF